MKPPVIPDKSVTLHGVYRVSGSGKVSNVGLFASRALAEAAVATKQNGRDTYTIRELVWKGRQ